MTALLEPLQTLDPAEAAALREDQRRELQRFLNGWAVPLTTIRPMVPFVVSVCMGPDWAPPVPVPVEPEEADLIRLHSEYVCRHAYGSTLAEVTAAAGGPYAVVPGATTLVLWKRGRDDWSYRADASGEVWLPPYPGWSWTLAELLAHLHAVDELRWRDWLVRQPARTAHDDPIGIVQVKRRT